MSRTYWTRIGVFAGILLIIFLIGITLLPFLLGGWWGMGPGMMGGQGSQGWCPFCGGTGRSPGGSLGGMLAWPFMLMGLLFPLGLLVLLILGIVWLVRNVSLPSSEAAAPPHKGCRHCGKPIDVDWRVCPFCEEDLLKLE